ncbi:DNA mismatch repair protein [Citrobacter braakii]|nr:DNA mismatch repair protein [Citrobacter braakii]
MCAWPPLTGNTGVTWETSHVRHKLKRVLWIPVEGERSIPLAERRVGSPLLWSPNEEEDRQLRLDWEELMDMIVLGHVERITARHGEVLQLRPKAANARAPYRGHWRPWRTHPDPTTRFLLEKELHARIA